MNQNLHPTKYFQCRLIQICALNSRRDLAAEEISTSSHSPSKCTASMSDIEIPAKRPFNFKMNDADISIN